ncbi:MAG: nucleoside triphosphate pyrophosphohydrolase [Ignavibacteriae bacterium]|nr:nucleoside triphosphate pyrophosphohydrolase [Ignavibacteriota bacterium]
MNTSKTTVPTIEDTSNLSNHFMAFNELVRILRDECPWDRKQTHESISHLLIEEAYETADAIAKKNDDELSKELGDLLLHVVMHSRIAEQRGAFSLQNVIEKVFTRLVHRHPHVFGDISVQDENEVLQNWEALKMKEGRKSVLEGVPAFLPALLRAQRTQEKAANVGFDWDKKEDVWAKVEEEMLELKTELMAGDKQKAANEFGDVLFSLVNAARFEGLVAEETLQATTKKFINRFQFIEEQAGIMNKKLSEMSLAEMDVLWNEAKQKEQTTL